MHILWTDRFIPRKYINILFEYLINDAQNAEIQIGK